MPVDADDELRTLIHRAIGETSIEPERVEHLLAGAKRRRSRLLWEAAATLALALVVGAGLAISVAVRNHAAIPNPTQLSAAATPCVPAAPEPPAVRLAAPEDLSDTHLAVVEPSLQPKVSAADALARNMYQANPRSCAFRGVLAYFSSTSAGTYPSACAQPPTGPTSPSCAIGTSPTLFTHILAWVFTWRNDCGPSGGGPPPAGQTLAPAPPSAPFSCGTILVLDATTGQWIIEMGGPVSILGSLRSAATSTPAAVSTP